MDEQRKFKRYEVKEVNGSLLYTMDINVLDLSVHGMKIESSRRLDVGRKYAVKIGHNDQLIRLSGSVVWCTLSRTKSSVAGEFIPVYQAGVEFDGILSEKAGELVDFLKQNAVISLEDRIFGRFKCDLGEPVNIDCEYDFLVKRISQSGMLIETEIFPDVDSIFEMEMKTANTSFPVKGRVAYVKTVKEGKEGKLAHIGLEFIDLSGEAENVLDSFIKNELIR